MSVTGITAGAVVCAGTLIQLTRACRQPGALSPGVPAWLIIAAVAPRAVTAVMTSFAIWVWAATFPEG